MTVNTEALYSQETADYLSTADRRIVSGFRFALQLQGLTIPDAAVARPSGPRRRVDLMTDYYANNPANAYVERQRDQANKNARTNTHD